MAIFKKKNKKSFCEFAPSTFVFEQSEGQNEDDDDDECFFP